MNNVWSPSLAASACSCSAQLQSHRPDAPVLRISMQTESMADESKKGHSGGGARDMPVCSESTDAMLKPPSCVWRVVGMARLGTKSTDAGS